MGQEALSLGADTFQFFTRNPRGGKTKEINPEDVAGLRKIMKDHHFPVILAHAPYTMNLCSANPETRAFGEEMMRDDLLKLELLPGNLYNFHPGSHTGQGTEKGIREIADSLNRLLTEEMHTTVLLETMAGKGSEVGGRFEELREIIDLLNCPERIGIYLDTCHVHDAGYDIINDLDGVLGEFDRIIGLERLKAIHLNDCKNVCGSHKDRHEKLGEGCIGNEALMRIVTHPLLHDLPFFLETPNDSEGYKKEISTVRTWRTDTVKADGVQTDTVKAECVQTDTVKAGGVQTDTVKADCVQTDTVKAECVQTDIVKTGGAKTEKLRGTIL